MSSDLSPEALDCLHPVVKTSLKQIIFFPKRGKLLKAHFSLHLTRFKCYHQVVFFLLAKQQWIKSAEEDKDGTCLHKVP